MLVRIKILPLVTGLLLLITMDTVRAQVFCKRALSGSIGAMQATSGFSIRYLNAYWSVDPAVIAIHGNLNYVIKRESGTANSLVMELVPSMEIELVKVNNAVVVYHPLNNGLSIPLPDTFSSAYQLQIVYQGIPASTGFGSFQNQTHLSGNVLWTLSQPFFAKDWWPVIQDLSYKIDSADVFIKVPTGNYAVSNGVLLDTVISNGSVTYHYQTKYPIAYYLVAMAAGTYAVIKDTVILSGDTLPYFGYAYPQDTLAMKNAMQLNKNHLHLFTQLFGDYPFKLEKYAHAQCGFGGGMEHQTVSFEGNFMEELWAHELAHQWFGDKVTCASWKDIWLNEGFATYLSGLVYYYQQRTNEWLNFKETHVKKVVTRQDGTVYAEEYTDFERIFDGRLSYSKGAMVLHMLRNYLGDEAFYSGVNKYLTDRAYSNATTYDLVTALSLYTDKDVSAFMDKWVYKWGYPSFNLQYKQDTVSYRITGFIKQIIKNTSVDFYPLKLPVLFHLTGGDTILNITFNSDTFVLDSKFSQRVISVVIDPDFDVISAFNTVNLPYSRFMDSGIHLYPVPFNKEVTLEYHNVSDPLLCINVVNSLGQVVKQFNFANQQGLGVIILDFSRLSSGLYNLEMFSRNTVINEKVIYKGYE